jgi:hypothetical protein
MKISYAITVCNEFIEIQRLITFLLEHKRPQDEIVVLVDTTKAVPELISYLAQCERHYEGHMTTWKDEFKGNFADWKNKLTSYCNGDYIFQIDADEMPCTPIIESLPAILEHNSAVDLYAVPRVNTVDGLTTEHVTKWGWNVNSEGWVNWPDYQTRIYKNVPEIKWVNKVHERLEGHKQFAYLPMEEDYSLYHPKTIERQVKQNEYYDTL